MWGVHTQARRATANRRRSPQNLRRRIALGAPRPPSKQRAALSAVVASERALEAVRHREHLARPKRRVEQQQLMLLRAAQLELSLDQKVFQPVVIWVAVPRLQVMILVVEALLL